MELHFKKNGSVKLLALVQFILIYAFIFSPWTKFPVTFIIVIIAICLLSYWKDRTLAAIGLNLHSSFIKTVGIAVLLFITIGPILDFIVQPLITKLTGEIVDYSAYQSLAHNFPKYAKYVLFILISASFGEELLFRGFVFRQFKIILPAFKFKTILIAILSAILFSLPHLYLGLSGFIMTFIFGLIFAIIYIKSNYNLWITIIFHALIDIMFLTLAYFDKLNYYTLSNDLFFGY